MVALGAFGCGFRKRPSVRAINLDIKDSPSVVTVSDKLESAVIINSPVSAVSAGSGAVVVDSPDAAIPAMTPTQHGSQAASRTCLELSLSAPKPFRRRRNAAVAKNEGVQHPSASPVACTAEIPSSLSWSAEHADANEGWGEEGKDWSWVEEEEEREQAEVDVCVDLEDKETATHTPIRIPHVSNPRESLGGTSTGTSAGELICGASVVLQGLRAAPELNGSLGVLTRFHSDTGRWDVALGRHGTKALKPENLVVQTSDLSVGSVRAGAAPDDWDWLEEMGYVPGARVVLTNVPTSPELTDKVGTLVAFDSVSHLWKVEIDNVGVQSFKPANLVVQDEEEWDADVDACAEECGEEEVDAEAGDECVEPDAEEKELPSAKRVRTE